MGKEQTTYEELLGLVAALPKKTHVHTLRLPAAPNDRVGSVENTFNFPLQE